MKLLRNKSLLLLLISTASACGLVDLSVLEVTTYPETPDDVLPEKERLSLLFSEPVDRPSTEDLLLLSGPEGICDGIFDWDNNRMIFSPDKKMQPGFRYNLKFKGDLRTPDGRTFSKDIILPFYYATNALPPLLVSFNPSAAEITGIKRSIELQFSKPMKKNLFEQNFTISPQTVLEFAWNIDYESLIISPKTSWLNLQYYKWTIPEAVTDNKGIPVPEAYSGTFLVQIDTSPPTVTGIHPAKDNEDGSFAILSDLGPEELKLNEHIALLFSEAVDFSSLRLTFGIDPSIDGYLIPLTPDSALYYINENLPPDTEYRLSIENGLKDLSGNAATLEWETVFTPDIPAQKVSLVEIEDENGLFLSLDNTDFGKDGYIDTPGIDYYDGECLHFIITLTEPFPETAISARAAFGSLISITTVFPPGVLAPTLFTSAWESPVSLRLIYSALSSFLPDNPVYYNFKIKAGSADSATPGGSYLTETIEFTFLAEEE